MARGLLPAGPGAYFRRNYSLYMGRSDAAARLAERAKLQTRQERPDVPFLGFAATISVRIISSGSLERRPAAL